MPPKNKRASLMCRSVSDSGKKFNDADQQHGCPQQLLQRRYQVARRGLPPREAHHLRGRRGPPAVRQTAVPQHQDPLSNKILNQFKRGSHIGQWPVL